MNKFSTKMRNQMIPSEKTIKSLIEHIKSDEDTAKYRKKKLFIKISSAAACVVLVGLAVWSISNNVFSDKIDVVQNSTISDVSALPQSQGSISDSTRNSDNMESSTAAVTSSANNLNIVLSQEQLNILGAKYYPAPFKTSKAIPATWETVFDFREVVTGLKQRDFYACAYVTVIGTATGELSHKEGTIEGRTYTALKVDRVVCGNLEQGQTIVVNEPGYYDETTKSWVDTHPGFVPLKAGDKFLTVIYSGTVQNTNVDYYLPNIFNGYIEEIDGKSYLVYRSDMDNSASAIGKSVGKESLFDVKSVPSKLYENQTEEIAVVDPAAMEQIIKDILS